MDIDYLIDHFASEAGQKEQVALLVYYLENKDDGETAGITQAQVKEVIRNSRSGVSTSSISMYFSRLDSDGWISEANGDSYILTHDGEDGVEELLDDDALDNPREEEDRFLDLTNFEDGDERYKQLVEDINETYRYRIYDATVVLTRKFFEDLVFQILVNHYAGEDDEMYYDQENGQHYPFDELLSNFKEGVPTLRQYSRELERDLIEDLRDLKDEGNTGAHSIRVDFTDEEVEEWAGDATTITEILYDVLRGTRIADEEED